MKSTIQWIFVCYRLCLILLLVTFYSPFSAYATTPESIRIIPLGLTVSDDSVRIDLAIRAKGIAIPTEQSLTLTPSLHFEGKEVSLPPIVFSGSRRARFDRREETVNPDRNKPLPYHTWVCSRRRNDYELRYTVSIPYASWMEHASLRLKQVSRDCCTETLLADDVLTADMALPSPCVSVRDTVVMAVEAPVTKEAKEVKEVKEVANSVPKERRIAVTLYIDYPRGGSRVDPAYGNNYIELKKVDNLLVPLLGDYNVNIQEIRITGYASPDGAYYDNEALAKARSLSFRSYLAKSYGLQDYPFRTAWVAEDWEGLRLLLKGKPYEKEASLIIDRYGIFEGRERHLMDLQGRQPYRDMMENLFPRLRRIELNILYNERNVYEK